MSVHKMGVLDTKFKSNVELENIQITVFNRPLHNC